MGESLNFILDEIYNESKTNKEEISLINSLMNIRKFNNKIDLLSDKEYKLYYKVDLLPMIENNIEEIDIFNLFCQGWELNESKNCLIKKI